MSLKYWKRVLVGLGMISIASVLLYWCFQQINLAMLVKDLSKANFGGLIIGMLFIYSILLINAWQWQLFLPHDKPLRFKRIFRVISIMAMMTNVVPWGHAFTVYHLGQIERVGKTVALSVMTLDQVVEGIAKLAIFLLVSWLVPIPAWMKNGIQIVVVVVIVSYFAVLFFAYRHRKFEERHADELKSTWHRVTHFVSKWAHYMYAIRDYKKTLLAILFAILMKLCEVGAVYMVQRAFDVDLPFWASLFVVAAYNLSTMIPVTPGNLGVFEATIFFIYKSLGVPPTQAMSLALFNHIVYLIPMIIPGYSISVRQGIKLSRSSA